MRGLLTGKLKHYRTALVVVVCVGGAIQPHKCAQASPIGWLCQVISGGRSRGAEFFFGVVAGLGSGLPGCWWSVECHLKAALIALALSSMLWTAAVTIRRWLLGYASVCRNKHSHMS